MLALLFSFEESILQGKMEMNRQVLIIGSCILNEAPFLCVYLKQDSLYFQKTIFLMVLYFFKCSHHSSQ